MCVSFVSFFASTVVRSCCLVSYITSRPGNRFIELIIGVIGVLMCTFWDNKWHAGFLRGSPFGSCSLRAVKDRSLVMME